MPAVPSGAIATLVATVSPVVPPRQSAKREVGVAAVVSTSTRKAVPCEFVPQAVPVVGAGAKSAEVVAPATYEWPAVSSLMPRPTELYGTSLSPAPVPPNTVEKINEGTPLLVVSISARYALPTPFGVACSGFTVGKSPESETPVAYTLPVPPAAAEWVSAIVPLPPMYVEYSNWPVPLIAGFSSAIKPAPNSDTLSGGLLFWL